MPNNLKQKDGLVEGQVLEMTKGNRLLMGIKLVSSQLHPRHK